jgi:hypothetical protein
MTTQQPVALRLADVLENKLGGAADEDIEKAAAELRRLHARDKEWESVTGFMQTTTDRMESELLRLHSVNAQLLEALCCVRDMVGHPDNLAFIDAAIAAAKEMK